MVGGVCYIWYVMCCQATPELADDVCRTIPANHATAENLPAMETTFIQEQLGRVRFAPTDVIWEGFGRFTPRCSTAFETRSSSWTESMSIHAAVQLI